MKKYAAYISCKKKYCCTGLVLICLSVFVMAADTISFQLHWVPQAQFAGYYCALEQGIYARHGLHVKICNGGPGINPSEQLKKGSADIASMWLTNGIKERAEGNPLRLIAQIEQKSALMLVAKKTSGIKTPADMDGKKISLWDEHFRIQPKAFFKKFNITPRIISQSYTVNLFLRDAVDVASVMWYNEFHTLLNSGLDSNELRTFFFYDYGLNFPEAGLYICDQGQQSFDKYCRFVRASCEGWKYALSHEKEAVDLVIQQIQNYHIAANRMHQLWMLRKMKDMLISTNNSHVSIDLTKEDYERVANALLDDGSIRSVPDFSSFILRCNTK